MDAPAPHAWPVSIKGVVIDREDRVLLLRNERQEWELPGGRLELGEEPAECVIREIAEETTGQAIAILEAMMVPNLRWPNDAERHPGT